jgi:hypothetical protein
VLSGPIEDILALEHRARAATPTASADTASAATDADGSAPAAADHDGSASAEADHDGSASAEAVTAGTGRWASNGEVAATLADAIIVGTRLAPDTSGLDRHTLVLHTPADALTEPGPGHDPVPARDTAGRIRHLDRRVLRRLACQAGIVLHTNDTDGHPLDVGRRRRQPTTALRRAVHARDRHRCRYPGCHTTRNLHVHHIHHWAQGGPTTLDNLITLCAHHHRHLHHVENTPHAIHPRLDTDGTHQFHLTDGTPLPHSGPTQPILDQLTTTTTGDPASADTDSASAEADRHTTGTQPLAPHTWYGPGHYDLDLAIAVLQTELDRALPPTHLTTAA